MKDTILKGLGIVLLVAFWVAVEKSAIPQLLDWSTAELVGYNTFTLATLGVVIYMIYKIIKRK